MGIKSILGKKYPNINSRLKMELKKPVDNNLALKEMACTINSIDEVVSNNSYKKVVRNNDIYEQVIKEVAATYYEK